MNSAWGGDEASLRFVIQLHFRVVFNSLLIALVFPSSLRDWPLDRDFIQVLLKLGRVLPKDEIHFLCIAANYYNVVA